MDDASSLSNLELGELVIKIGDSYVGTAEFGAQVRKLFEGSESKNSHLDSLRAEVTRTAAVVQALALGRAFWNTNDCGEGEFKKALCEEERRLINIRERQAKLDTVLGGGQPVSESLLAELNRLDDFMEEAFPYDYSKKTSTVDLAIKLLGALA